MGEKDMISRSRHPRARMLLGKAHQNIEWDIAFFRAHHLPMWERLRYVSYKYAAILTNARTVSYLGSPFHYDNRWTPALLQPYVVNLNRLDALIDLGKVRTVLDVGANIGQFAATALAVFPHLSVWSLEPNPSILHLLQRNSQRHPNWHVLPFGLANEDQRRKLWFVPEKSAQGSMYRDNAQSGLLAGHPISADVELRRLDTRLCAELGMPTEFDLVKVDVEGFEHEALLGLRDVHWRYLELEASVRRTGQLDDPERLVSRLWGSGCRLIDASPVNETTVVQELVFTRSG